jgi:hypothetical protein
MKTRNALIGTGILFVCVLSLCCAAGIGYIFYSSLNTNQAHTSVTNVSTSIPFLFSVPPTLIPSAPTPAYCPDKMAAIMQANQGSTYGPDNSNSGGRSNSSDSNPDIRTLATYQVNGDQISNPSYEKVSKSLKKDQQDTASQEQAWQFFTTLIPLQDRQMVSEYQVFTDGPGNVLAAVEQSDNDPDKWMMEIDVEDLQNKDQLAFTLVHEDGHLLTLNSQQVPADIKVFNDPNNDELYSQEAAACPTYFTDEGCSKPNSYINIFYGRFWTPIASEWEKIDKHSNDSDPTEYYDMLHAFYQKHSNQFVDDYAITDSSEDMAETFAYFVYSPKPTGQTIKDQKILFFYDYPELIQVRDQILKNTCAAMQ